MFCMNIHVYRLQRRGTVYIHKVKKKITKIFNEIQVKKLFISVVY